MVTKVVVVRLDMRGLQVAGDLRITAEDESEYVAFVLKLEHLGLKLEVVEATDLGDIGTSGLEEPEHEGGPMEFTWTGLTARSLRTWPKQSYGSGPVAGLWGCGRLRGYARAGDARGSVEARVGDSTRAAAAGAAAEGEGERCCCWCRERRRIRRSAQVGHLIVPRQWNDPETLDLTPGTWACDNGCFVGLDAGAFMRMLYAYRRKPGCLFVSVPDCVGDAAETLQLWGFWSQVVRSPAGRRRLSRRMASRRGACPGRSSTRCSSAGPTRSRSRGTPGRCAASPRPWGSGSTGAA